MEMILRRMEELGAHREAQQEMRKHLALAEKLSGELPWPSWARASFQELLSFLATREA